MGIQYVTGDATRPLGAGPKIIVHVCNDIGGWGAGFVLAISRRWRAPEERYRAWHRGETEDGPFELGAVQFVEVEPLPELLHVANLIGQRDVRARGGVPPIRYDAVRVGLRAVATHATHLGASLHMPRIGCGLAGGRWEDIGSIVDAELVGRGLDVTVYDFTP